MKSNRMKSGWWSTVLALALSTAVFPPRATTQDQGQQDDPPTRVARLGYMEGSVSLQPAGETEWVQAVANRPMTTGDKLWADKGSRAELQLGSAVIRLSENTGVSFLNLDDHTAQIQLSSGTINLSVRRLDQNDDFEVDTPDLAFTVSRPGNYRLDASEDGTYTVVSLRGGEGQATGNGQTYTLHAGEKATFSGGTDSLNANVEDLAGPDQFDNWADGRDHRYDNSRSAQYVSRDVVGYEDLDDNGSWRDDQNYGHVWYPNNVAPGWAPYREGHWDWISPWGYTWVDDSSWGYAPFHYGRWVAVGGRWGWIAGPVNVQPVYAPALVVFIGGGGGGFGGDVGWFPLGPREVYVPPYQVSRGYMNQVNVSNTTVNTTTITNVYNTTIINKSTNITNVTYANRNVQGAVTVVPQRAFAGAQPVGRAAIAVNPQQIARAPISARAAVLPTQQSVLGAKASTANRVTAPPAAVMNRQVVAKRTPPPPPVPFAKQQQALAAHPGEPLAKHEIQNLRPAGAAAARPMVKQAPPGKPATPTTGRPGNPPNAGRPGQPTPPPAQTNRPPAAQPQKEAQPTNRPPAAQPQKEAQPTNRPPAAQPQNRPPAAQPQNRPPAAQPQNRPAPPAETNRPPAAQPPNRPPAAQPQNRPPAAQPQNRPAPPAETNRPPAAQPPNRPAPPAAQPPNRPPAAQPQNRPPAAQPSQPPPRPQTPPPAAAKPAPPPPHQQPNLTPEQKKKQEEQQKKQEKPPGA
jgi:hypothetical protein